MSKGRDLRHKTTNLDKEFIKIKRKLSNKAGPSARDRDDQFDQLCLTPTSRQFTAMQYSNRDSGRINFSPLLIRNKQKYNPELAKNQVRSQLLKLSYKEKLLQIESFFKNARDLCKQYGYFTVTFAMLTFHLNQTIKINLWIHPDPRSSKPLHPIKKRTPFQCQLICMSELKNLIKKIFPTVDLGSGKTFGNTIAHIQSLITQMNNRKNRAITGLVKYQRGTNLIKNERKLNNCQTEILKPIVNISKRIKTTDQQMGMGDNQNNRYKYLTDERNKETVSTLLESIRSVNSIKQRLRKQLSKTPNKRIESIENNSRSKSKRQNYKQRKTSWIQEKVKTGQKERVQKKLAETLPHKNMQTFITNIHRIKQQQMDNEEESPKKEQLEQEFLYIKAHENRQKQKEKQKQKQKQKEKQKEKEKEKQKESTDSSPTKRANITNSRLAMKTSITGTGKKPMSISIQMQNQMNNLFGSCDELSLNNFYNQQVQKKKAKNSILSKVAEQFQDLF